MKPSQENPQTRGITHPSAATSQVAVISAKRHGLLGLNPKIHPLLPALTGLLALCGSAPAAIKVAGQLLIDQHYTRGVETATGIVGSETSVVNWFNYGQLHGSFLRVTNSAYASTMGSAYISPPNILTWGGIATPSAPGSRMLVASFPTPADLCGQTAGVGKPYTVEMWVWKNNSNVDQRGLLAWTENTVPGSDAGKLCSGNPAVLHNNGKDLNYVTIPARDQWVHLAATYDGTTETIYTNGVANGSHSVNLNVNGAGNTYYPMLFSGILTAAPNSSSFSFNGGIAAVRVHTGALSASDVADNYNEGISTVPVVNVFVDAGTATGLSSTTASLSGNLAITSDPASTELTVYCDTVDHGNTTVGWAHSAVVSAPNSAGSFSATVSGLTQGTNYYFRVHGVNANGDGWSLVKPFSFGPPSIANSPARAVSQDTATLDGTLNPNSFDTTVKICWGKTDGGTVEGNWEHVDSLGSQPLGTVTSNLTGLDVLTTYYYTYEATNALGTIFATPSLSFTTWPTMDRSYWTSTSSGTWSLGTNWQSGTPPVATSDTNMINFNVAGTYTSTNDLGDGFKVNQLNFGAGTVTLDGNSLSVVGTYPVAAITQASTGAVIVNSAVELAVDTTAAFTSTAQMDLAGVVSGTGALTKSGSGTLKIVGLAPGTGNVVSNTYSGGTIMNSGTLHVGGMYAGISPACTGVLGTGPVTLNSGTIEFDNVTADNALTCNGGTIYSPNGWGVRWTGPITLNAATTFNAGYGLTCSGGISGTGGVIKTGNDTLTLSGTNSYTGSTTINAGTVLYNSAADQTLTGNISGIGNLTKAGTGMLTLTGVVSYTGATALTAGTLVLNNAAAQTLAGVISGAGALTQAGPGSLTLPNVNSYTGATTVSGGTLLVTGSTVAASAVSVASGATLGGTGTINGDVTMDSGAMFLLSTSTPLTLKKVTMNNNVVHLNLPTGLVDGVYTVATYTNATSTGTLAPLPVIDSGSLLVPGTAMSVVAADGIVTLTVGNPPIVILPATIPNGTPNTPYSKALSAAGGFGAPYQNYAVVSGALPDGLTLSSTGLISGTPTTLGTSTFAVQVQDQYGYLADVPKSYTMSIVLLDAFSWVTAVSGDWSDASMWSNTGGVTTAPAAAGQTDYVLNFTPSGTYTATHNLNDGFLLNQLNFGGAATIAGTNGLALTNNGATLPTINQNSTSAVAISTPLSLAADVTVGGSGNGQVDLAGLVSGAGSLTKSSSGTLKIYGLVPNTYSGGTIISTGTLHVGTMVAGISPHCTGVLGTGPVTLGMGTTIQFDNVTAANALTSNGGTIFSPNGWGVRWTGPITLNATTTFNAGYGLSCSGGITGTGGVIKTGNDTLALSGTNSYTGSTTINAGTVAFDSAADQSLTGDISGPGNLAKAGAGSLTLTGVVSYTGTTTLTAGTLVLNNAAPQTLAAISGAGNLTQAGPGTLTLATNTYTGDTTVTGGVLIVNGTSIPDTGKLTISGGKVEPTGTETVDTLYFGATQKAAGTWGATGSGASHIDDVHFAGTAGTVLVMTAPTGTDYDLWALEFPNFNDTAADSDPDGDGMTNQQEYAFGLNPTLGSSVSPITSGLSTGGMFTYTRRNPNLTALVYSVWTSSNLQTWTEDTGASQTPDSPTAEVQSVSVTVTAAPGGGKLFVRVQAAPAP